MEQEKLLEELGESYGYLKVYVEKRIELVRLEATEKVALSLSFVITLLLLLLAGGFVLGLLTLALGFFLSERMGSPGQAFLVLAGGYAILALLIYFFRNPLIRNPLIGEAIRSLEQKDR